MQRVGTLQQHGHTFDSAIALLLKLDLHSSTRDNNDALREALEELTLPPSGSG